jgi:hypothetical protein
MSFDSYCAYKQSYPDNNWHFSRRWQDPEFTPADLDRLADHELSVGHVQKAEMLAWRAAAMREVQA